MYNTVNITPSYYSNLNPVYHNPNTQRETCYCCNGSKHICFDCGSGNMCETENEAEQYIGWYCQDCKEFAIELTCKVCEGEGSL